MDISNGNPSLEETLKWIKAKLFEVSPVKYKSTGSDGNWVVETSELLKFDFNREGKIYVEYLDTTAWGKAGKATADTSMSTFKKDWFNISDINSIVGHSSSDKPFISPTYYCAELKTNYNEDIIEHQERIMGENRDKYISPILRNTVCFALNRDLFVKFIHSWNYILINFGNVKKELF